MKTVALLLTKLLLASIIFAQEKIFEYDLSGDILYAEKPILYPTLQVAGNAVYSHLLVGNKTQIKHLYQNQQGLQKEIILKKKKENPEDTTFDETKPEKNIHQLYFRSRRYAHIATPDELLDVLYYQKTSSYYFISTNTKTGEITITDTLAIRYQSELVDYIIDGTTISLIHHIWGTNQFKVSKKEWHNKIQSNTISIDLGGKKGFTIPNYAGNPNNYNTNFYSAETNLWVPPAALYHSALSFRNKYELSILVNNNNFGTTIVVIDLQHLSYKLINHNTPAELLHKKGDYISTWLIDSLLIRGYGTSDSIFLFLSKKNDTLNYKKVFITKDNFSQLISGEIQKFGNFWSASNIKNVSFSEFLKKCNSNKLLITGYEEKGGVYLTLATKYDLLATSTLLGNIFTLGLLNFSQVKQEPLYEFDMSINLQSGTLKVGETKKFVWEKLLMFIFANRRNFLSLDFSNIDSYFYVNVFNPGTKKMTTYRFHKFL